MFLDDCDVGFFRLIQEIHTDIVVSSRDKSDVLLSPFGGSAHLQVPELFLVSTHRLKEHAAVLRVKVLRSDGSVLQCQGYPFTFVFFLSEEKKDLPCVPECTGAPLVQGQYWDNAENSTIEETGFTSTCFLLGRSTVVKIGAVKFDVKVFGQNRSTVFSRQ